MRPEGEGPDRGSRLHRAATDAIVLGTMRSAVPVTFHVYGQLRTYCGGAEQLPIAARTVRDVLAALARRYPALYVNMCDETGAVRRHLNVFVNADNVRDLDGVDTMLARGDVLTILPAVSGG